MTNGRSRLFSAEFDDDFAVEDGTRSRAYFGRNVLRGLIDGIDDFVSTYSEVPRRDRDPSPVLLGCAPWLDDEELLGRMVNLTAACVVMTKQSRSRKQLEKLKRLQELNANLPGVPVRAFRDLAGLATKVDGQAMVIGPYGPRADEIVLPTVRTIGFRKNGKGDQPPLMHAKLVLLGDTHWWETEFGEEVQSFVARRLWVSSANLTASSRRSLEFGYWTEEKALVEGAERFLLRLVAASEDVDPDAALLSPDLVPYEFDNEAFWEALGEPVWDIENEEP